MVHENFRFQSPMLAVRRGAGRAAPSATPISGRISFRTGYDVYAGQPYLATEERFIILDLGIHVLDIARVLLGEVERLYCETQRVNPGIARRGHGDHACSTTRPAPSASSTAATPAELDPDPFPETLLELEGTRGSLRLLARLSS